MGVMSRESDNDCSVSLPHGTDTIFLPVVVKKRGGGPKPLTTEQRIAHFWSRIAPFNERGCRLWQGGVTKDGYGQVHLGRLADGRCVHDYAHRIVWRLAHGPIPPGLVVRHKVCDTPACCTESHLLLGTQGDNIRDAAQQGKYKAERPGGWVIPADLRPYLIEAALRGPRGTAARLAREHGLNFRSFAVAVCRARQKQQRQRRLPFGHRRVSQGAAS